jgi:hypothetical protein
MADELVVLDSAWKIERRLGSYFDQEDIIARLGLVTGIFFLWYVFFFL